MWNLRGCAPLQVNRPVVFVNSNDSPCTISGSRIVDFVSPVNSVVLWGETVPVNYRPFDMINHSDVGEPSHGVPVLLEFVVG